MRSILWRNVSGCFEDIGDLVREFELVVCDKILDAVQQLLEVGNIARPVPRLLEEVSLEAVAGDGRYPCGVFQDCTNTHKTPKSAREHRRIMHPRAPRAGERIGRRVR